MGVESDFQTYYENERKIFFTDVVENNLMKNEAAKALNVFLHLINTVSCFLDIWISGR